MGMLALRSGCDSSAEMDCVMLNECRMISMFRLASVEATGWGQAGFA